MRPLVTPPASCHRYDFALELFQYERSNLGRDQQAASRPHVTSHALTSPRTPSLPLTRPHTPSHRFTPPYDLGIDHQAAELGDAGRGLGSDDLPAIQSLRVPCLLNAAACLLKLDEEAQAAAQAAAQAGREAGGEAAGGESRHALAALSRCTEVLRAGPCAASRAKALFRQAQAHAALHSWREAWQA